MKKWGDGLTDWWITSKAIDLHSCSGSLSTSGVVSNGRLAASRNPVDTAEGQQQSGISRQELLEESLNPENVYVL